MDDSTLPNCLSSWMSEPLPNELVRLAWKARVGYSWDKTATQRFWYKIEWRQKHSHVINKMKTRSQLLWVKWGSKNGCGEVVKSLLWPRWGWDHTYLAQRWDVSKISPFSDMSLCFGNEFPWDHEHRELGWWHQMSRPPVEQPGM